MEEENSEMLVKMKKLGSGQIQIKKENARIKNYFSDWMKKLEGFENGKVAEQEIISQLE